MVQSTINLMLCNITRFRVNQKYKCIFVDSMGNKPIYGNVGIVGFDECDNLLLYIPIFLRIFIRFIINVRHYLILLFKITSTKNKNMSLHLSLSLSLLSLCCIYIYDSILFFKYTLPCHQKKNKSTLMLMESSTLTSPGESLPP